MTIGSGAGAFPAAFACASSSRNRASGNSTGGRLYCGPTGRLGHFGMVALQKSERQIKLFTTQSYTHGFRLGQCSIIRFLVDFESYMAVLGVGRAPIGLVAPCTFKILDSQPDSSNMGPGWIHFHRFHDFQKSCRVFLTLYLSCFRPGCFQISIFEVFGREQKDARRKVMQIRGGITSRSAFFDHFVTI